MNTTDFGKKVAYLRKKKGLTQSQLAEKINVSNKAVSRWETGEGYPEITILTTLAKELDITVDELLKDDAGMQFKNEDTAGFEEGYSFSKVSKEKKHNNIPVKKPYWKSFIIFNKIGAAIVCTNFITLLLYILSVAIFSYFNELAPIMFIPTILYGLATSIGKLGLAVTIIGLLAGLFDLYDRQIRASVILAIILFITTYILPFMVVSFSNAMV